MLISPGAGSSPPDFVRAALNPLSLAVLIGLEGRKGQDQWPEQCESRRRTHDGHGFVAPRVVPVGTRSPIDGVFQDAGHALVVLRSHNQNGVRAAESLAAKVFMASEPKDSKPEPPPIRPIQEPAVVHDKVVTWQS